MKIVIFGLSLSSSWGNGHATIWRALLSALYQRGHTSVFFERDVHYYAARRDLNRTDYSDLCLYPSWDSIREQARREADDADVAIVTSYCPDAIGAGALVLESRAKLRTFYDLDTPITLRSLREERPVFYLPPDGLKDFDLVFSFTGGDALGLLQTRLGARRTAALYGGVDPEIYRPSPPAANFSGDLSYLGTYAEDRQASLDRLFLAAARRLPGSRFVIGGSLYPGQFPWSENIFYIPHVPPPDHPRFYSSSRMTLNVTRGAMAAMGHCPSGRLFEASACGAALLSDRWAGIEEFFTPGSEIVIVQDTQDTLAAFDLTDSELSVIARRARERTLEEHTGLRRALDFERAIEAS